MLLIVFINKNYVRFQGTSGLPVRLELYNQYDVAIPTSFLKALGVKKVSGTFGATGSSSNARNAVFLGNTPLSTAFTCFYISGSNPIPTASYTFETDDFDNYQYLILVTAVSVSASIRSYVTFE